MIVCYNDPVFDNTRAVSNSYTCNDIHQAWTQAQCCGAPRNTTVTVASNTALLRLRDEL